MTENVLIRELYSRFYWALNAGDAQGMIYCFAPGGYTLRFRGDKNTPEESAGHALKFQEDRVGRSYQHHVTNAIVDPDPEGHDDRRAVRLYFFVTQVADPPQITVRWSCRAEDTVQLVDGQWRILRRQIRLAHDDTGDY